MIPVVKFGSYVLMCENVYLNKRTWHFRRRVPEDVRHLHRKVGRKKPPEYLDFSLKTQNKEEAARKAHEETLRLDRLWAQARSDDTYIPKIELALQTIANAGLQPGVGAIYPDLDPLDTFVGDYLGYQEDSRGRPTGEVRRPNPQQKLTLDILYGAPVPKRLSEARDKHWALGTRPKNKVAQGQFDRAWGGAHAGHGGLLPH